MKTKKRILVMGAAGFTGRALCDHLEKTSGENVQVVRASISARGDHRIVEYDGRSSAEVKHLFASVQPHQIYHLVGSYTGEYDTDYMSNVLCAKNVLDAVLTQRKEHPRVLVVGSAAAVGLVKRGDLPVKESVALSPVTMYGLTKAAQALLATSYFRMYQADVVVARMFNIIGLGMSQQLFVGRLLAQVSSYMRGDITEIVMGNLKNKRDYLDIQDVVSAYDHVMNRGKSGEVYNVGSGKSISSQALVDLFCKSFGIPKKVIKASDLPHWRSDLPDVRCSNGKLRALGWRQTLTIEESVDAIRQAMLKG